MTLSILARDPETGAIGAAAATGNLAVGAWVLRAAAGAGAVATQGLSVSPIWGDKALQMLQAGQGAENIVADLTASDEGKAYRQLTVLDRTGAVEAWTGVENPLARGHLTGEGYVIAGNWLTAVSVLRDMELAYKDSWASGGTALAERLLAALEAGVKAGSDARGTQSAALVVVSTTRPPLDLRVDFDESPLLKLRALYERSALVAYQDWIDRLPTLEDPYRC